MRAVAYQPDGSLQVVDRPEPEPGPTDVVVAVERCGICGSDLHMRHARLLPAGAVMGHEFAGTVVAAGDQTSGVTTGARVAVIPLPGCGSCSACLAGRNQICANAMACSLGMGHADGAFAELVRVPATSCLHLPEGMTFEQGALIEPYAVGLHAVRRCTRLGDPASTAVGIIGAGPIGLMTLAALRAEGVRHVVVAERSERRAEVATALGAEAVVGDARQLGTALGTELDVIFDCAGSGATPELALENVRIGGEVVLIGVADPGDPVQMMGFIWILKEVDVRPCIAYTRDEFAEAVGAVAAGAVDVATVVSGVRPLEEAEASFDDLARAGGPVKVLLAPSA
jgi:(R,R)-butanediol dehydrogenase/meso-butanediol dehydrogenase/diacetyl reductase